MNYQKLLNKAEKIVTGIASDSNTIFDLLAYSTTIMFEIVPLNITLYFGVLILPKMTNSNTQMSTVIRRALFHRKNTIRFKNAGSYRSANDNGAVIKGAGHIQFIRD